MNVHRIYRVENSAGEGIYSASYLVSKPYRQSPNHPLPEHDVKLGPLYELFFQDHFKFAFATIDQLKNWVDDIDWRVDLNVGGLKVYEIEAVAWLGDTQAFYDPNTRVDVSTMRLTEI